MLTQLQNLVQSFGHGQLPETAYLSTAEMLQHVIGHEAMAAFCDNVDCTAAGLYFVEPGFEGELWRRVLIADPAVQAALEMTDAAGVVG